jgi:anti-anti-sigma factor
MQADLIIAGPFDGSFVTRRRTAIESLARKASDVEIDMSGTDHVDSSGLGALAFLYKRLAARGHKVRVLGLNGEPLRLFKNLKIDALFIGEAGMRA